MSNRGWKALDGVGVGDEVRKLQFLWKNAPFTWLINLIFNITDRKGKHLFDFERNFE